MAILPHFIIRTSLCCSRAVKGPEKRELASVSKMVEEPGLESDS